MKKRMVGYVCVTAVIFAAGMPVSAQNNSAASKDWANQPAAVASQAASSASSGQAPSAQPPAATPADPVVVHHTRIVVTALSGRVRYQYGEGEDAQKTVAKVGDTLREGVKVSVGPNSVITLRIGDAQDLTFDQLGNFIVTDAVNDGKTDVTRIKIAVGRMSFDVNKQRYENNVVLEAPDMTLAITGTSGAIQCTPGQPTLAIGAEDNRGQIELNYRATGNRVVMTRNERSDSSVPDPALQRSLAAVVETPTVAAREKDEMRVIKRTEGSNQTVPLDVGDINGSGMRIDLEPVLLRPPGTIGAIPPGAGVPVAQATLHMDATNGDLFETLPPLESSILRQGLAFDASATDGGAAIVTDPETGFRRFVYAESSDLGGIAKNNFSSVALESPITKSIALGNMSGAGVPLVRGLGAVRENLYASGRLDGADAIYALNLSEMAMEEVMSPGLTLEGGVGGLSERGTLVAFAHDPGAAPGSSLLRGGAIIEMDPRINYLAAVYTGASGSLDSSANATNHSNLNVNAIHSITGLAADSVSVTLAAVVGAGTSQSAMLRYDTTGSVPYLTDVRVAPDRFTTGLGSETTVQPLPPVALRDPTGPIDMVALNERFAMMAYSQQALNSGLVERALRAEILNHASKPQECDGSGALNALPAILMRHVDERGGIGRAVSEFRVHLEPLHPCRPGGNVN